MSVTDVFGKLDAAHGYIDTYPSPEDRMTGGVLYGLFLGLAAGVFLSVVRQTRFGHRPYFTFFKFLIWLQWCTCVAFGTIEWCRFEHKFPPSFAYFFSDIFLWAIQTHCLTQIAANRIGILVNSKRQRLIIKLSVFAFILVLNVMCYCSWGTASLQVANPVYYKILIPFNIVVMGGITLCDILLNAWFIVSVRRRLVNLGMKKYDRLVLMNIVFLCGSISLDATTLGLMWMKNPKIYLFVYPIAYILKLAIELSLSTLIVQIAQESPVKRMNKDTMSHASNTLAIGIETTAEIRSIKAESIDIAPSFGQFIRRPEQPSSDLAYVPRLTSQGSPASTNSYDDDSKSFASSSKEMLAHV